MLRYVAIGAVVGFVLAVVLLSRGETPAPLPSPAMSPPATVFKAPAGIRSRGELRLGGPLSQRGAILYPRVEAAIADGGL